MQTKRFHCVIDLTVCNELIDDPVFLKKFIDALAKEIGMTIIAGPLVAKGIPENPGYSALAIVDFSHISIHTFTLHKEALIDIFSCKPYDRERALSLCKETFSTSETVAREKEVWWGN